MRILYFSDSYGSMTTTFIRNEVEHFSKKFEVLYLAGKVFGGNGGVRCLELSYSPGVLLRKWRWYLWKFDLSCNFRSIRYGKELNRVIREFKPDIVHCHFAYEGLKLLQNLNYEVPVIVHFHGYDASQMLNKRSYVNALKKEFMRHKVTVIAVSDVMRNRLEKLHLLGSSHFILRYGIDLELFKLINGADESNEVFTLLQVSSLVEKKGHVYTLRALRMAFDRYPDLQNKVRAVFTGEGERGGQLEDLSEQLGLTQNVQFVGNKSQVEVISLLKAAHAFIQHSVTAENGDEEGIPNSIMEAMAMELPVLSTNHAGIPELVKHGINGLLCDERDVETLANQISQITEWKRLPANRKVIEENYNKERHNQKLEEIYRSKLKN